MSDLKRTNKRVYCWQVSAAFEVNEDGDCPECGVFGRGNHRVLEDNGLCQSFARCHWDDHGHPCDLAIDHQGPCRTSADCREKKKGP